MSTTAPPVAVTPSAKADERPTHTAAGRSLTPGPAFSLLMDSHAEVIERGHAPELALASVVADEPAGEDAATDKETIQADGLIAMLPVLVTPQSATTTAQHQPDQLPIRMPEPQTLMAAAHSSAEAARTLPGMPEEVPQAATPGPANAASAGPLVIGDQPDIQPEPALLARAPEPASHADNGFRVTSSPQATLPAGFAMQSATQQSAGITRIEIPVAVNHPGWQGSLAERVVWLVSAGQQTADLYLNPPELGPVEVRLSVGNGATAETTVQFASTHAPVREAIEAALPKLRDAFAQAGLTLHQATVSHGSFSDKNSGGETHRRPRTTTAITSSAAAAPIVASYHPRRAGMVDTFA